MLKNSGIRLKSVALARSHPFEKLAHSFLEVGPSRDRPLGIRRANLPKRHATVYDVPIDTV